MHLYFRDAEDVITVVGTGFFDNVWCYRKPNEQQTEKAMEWLKLLGIADLAKRRFPTLSSGEQRLVLLARTFIKNAPLLILDEPLHGLDVSAKRLIANIINCISQAEGLTLIYVTHYKNEIPSCVNNQFTLVKQ